MFAGGTDPVAKILEKSSAAALNAMEQGWSGPPFDPFALAELMHIPVIPSSEVLDARTIPLKGDRVQIEYNPTRPRARIRYSIAHEIAHTFFPDCSERVRNRTARQNCEPDEWELEMLCNIGAAELLMPTGSLVDLKSKSVSIQDVLELRKKFEVSIESILLRLIRITEQPYTMFVASRTESAHGRYNINYTMASRTSLSRLATNALLPKDSVVTTCTAMGYAAKSEEDWPLIGRVKLECVGISPYPESVYPRVIGFLHPHNERAQNTGHMQFVTGDATEPRGNGPLILAHIVNDTTPNWGAGFGKVVQKKWPNVQQRFRDSWFNSSRKKLGDIFSSDADPQLKVCQMVCQRGYGTSDHPRLRYSALRDCLTALRNKALGEKASIHMPRIGAGEAGGSWTLVSALIDEVLCAAGLSVTVYDLPNSRQKRPVQAGLF
jgi:Zn-dependent peptidase ImmA (M78 family)